MPLVEVRVERQPLPVYRTPSGKVKPISGRHASNWPHPRRVEIDGVVYVEQPLPSRTGWGITYHASRCPRTPIGTFAQQYTEGRASGFPFWPVLVFSARAAFSHYRPARSV